MAEWRLTDTILVAVGIGALIIMSQAKSISSDVVAAAKSVSSDVVAAFANAIKTAEGWFPGSWSYETNNPGNITDMGRPGQIGTKTNPKSGITFPVFDSEQSGWAALLWKVNRAFSGESSIYSPDMSISEFFQTYSGDQNEANNVAAALGVNPSTTLSDLMQLSNGGEA